jgi:hypothetical protein
MHVMKPDGYLPDGTPVYIKCGRGSGKSTLQLEMYKKILEEECIRLFEASMQAPPSEQLRFFVAGTGLHDSMAIEYWKNTEVIVVTRDGKEYQRGKRIK